MSILRVEEITKLDGSPFFPDLSPFVLQTKQLTGAVAFADSGFLHLVYDGELIYLPDGTEGSRVAFADLRGEFAIKPITILPAEGSGNTIADQSSISLDETNQAVGFVFSENNWVPLWDYGSFGTEAGALQPLRVTSPSVNAQPGILYLLDGTTQVVLPRGNNGERIAFADYANRFGQVGFNVTVQAQGGQTILGQGTYLLQEDGQVLDLVFWGDRWVVVNPDINRLLRDGANLVEGFTFPNEGLKIRDVLEEQTLTLSVGDNLSANRTLTLETNDQDVTLTVSASADISGVNTGDQSISLVGDVTGGPSQGEITTVISDGAVSLVKLAGIQSERLLGRISAGTGVPQELTYQQVANALSGTDVGDLVELEDVGGGVAGLPAVDASQLLNVVAGALEVPIRDEGVEVTPNLSSLDIVGNFLEVSAVGNDVTITSTAGDALTSQGLGQFASTTSAELATVITNETGTGSLVFGTAPTLTDVNLTGTPTAPTALVGTNTTQVATTAFVQQELGAFTGGLDVSFSSLNLEGTQYFNQADKPIERPNGTALEVGDRWWNTSEGSEWFWNGTYWLGRAFTVGNVIAQTDMAWRIGEDLRGLFLHSVIAKGRVATSPPNWDSSNYWKCNLSCFGGNISDLGVLDSTTGYIGGPDNHFYRHFEVNQAIILNYPSIEGSNTIFSQIRQTGSPVGSASGSGSALCYFFKLSYIFL